MALSDWELWACADKVIRQHGEHATVHIAERIDSLSRAGDAAGIAAWKAIAERVDRLNEQPTAERPAH